jgi:hypothetical protein
MNNLKPEDLTLDEITILLKSFPVIKAWIQTVEEYALEQAVKGIELPGFTLGLTRSTRVWIDEQQVITKLQDQDIDYIAPRTLLTPAQMEKLLGKKKFASLLADDIGSTIGNPKLLPKA